MWRVLVGGRWAAHAEAGGLGKDKDSMEGEKSRRFNQGVCNEGRLLRHSLDEQEGPASHPAHGWWQKSC